MWALKGQEEDWWGDLSGTAPVLQAWIGAKINLSSLQGWLSQVFCHSDGSLTNKGIKHKCDMIWFMI
jgi:hypothetical protein